MLTEKTYYEGERFENLALSEESVEGCRFVDCVFSGCEFDGCRLSRCYFSECRLENCVLRDLKTRGTEAKFLTLNACTVSGVNWGLLLPADGFSQVFDRVSGCVFRYGTFLRHNFRRMDLSDSSFAGCTFAECDFSEANLRKCVLRDCDFTRCDLSKADFRDAEGYRVDAVSCKVKGARFSLPEAVTLLYSLGVRIE